MKQGQFPAVLPLESLNGQNGFKIDGENNGDHSGYSVSGAGDFNGDQYADLLIGALGTREVIIKAAVMWYLVDQKWEGVEILYCRVSMVKMVLN